MRVRSLLLVAAILSSAAAPPGLDELSLPARLRATIHLVHATVKTKRDSQGETEVGRMLGLPPKSGGPARIAEPQAGKLKGDTAFVSIVIRRWNTDEELAGFEQALAASGGAALVKQMEKHVLGDFQFDTELRFPIRYAKTWMTPVGQVVRFAVVGRLFDWDSGILPDAAPVINIVEISLPRGQPSGTGTLVCASQVVFQEDGRMEMTAETMGSTTQSLSTVEREPPRD